MNTTLLLLIFLFGISFLSFSQPLGFQDQLKVEAAFVNNLFPNTEINSNKIGGIYVHEDGIFNVNNIPPTQDLVIYGDNLSQDWNSESSTISSLYFFNTTQPFINTTSIKVTNPTSGEALDLRLNSAFIDTTGYANGLDFWVYNSGNTAFPLQIQTFSDNMGGGESANISVDAEANKWTHFQFDWSVFGSPSKVGGIVIKLLQTQSQSLYFDEIKLLHCADMYSISTGDWNTPATWSCGRIPIVTDDITISAGHIISIPDGVNATLKFLYLLGTLNPLSGSTFNIYKF